MESHAAVTSPVPGPADANKPTLHLELGERWSVQSLEALLIRLRGKLGIGQRMALASRALLGTPFLPESKLKILPTGCVRFRLKTMDCCTAIYNLIALVNASSIEDLGHVLASIRYADGLLDNDPAAGTFLGFASEVLLKRAVAAGLLEVVTEQIGAGTEVCTMSLSLHAHRRPRFLDADETVTLPRYADGPQEFSYISVNRFDQVDWSRLRTGDIVLFTRGPQLKDGSPNFDFVNHLGIAIRLPQGIGLLHSTRHYTVAPLRPGTGTGVFYDDARTLEQIGFGFAGTYLGDSAAIHHDGDRIYGYDCTTERSLLEYAASNFVGLAVLRCRPHKSVSLQRTPTNWATRVSATESTSRT